MKMHIISAVQCIISKLLNFQMSGDFERVVSNNIRRRSSSRDATGLDGFDLDSKAIRFPDLKIRSVCKSGAANSIVQVSSVRESRSSDFEGWCWPGNSKYPDFTSPKVQRNGWKSIYSQCFFSFGGRPVQGYCVTLL